MRKPGSQSIATSRRLVLAFVLALLAFVLYWLRRRRRQPLLLTLGQSPDRASKHAARSKPQTAGASQQTTIDASSLADVADGDQEVRLQVAITRLKLRNLPQHEMGAWNKWPMAASLRKALLGYNPSGPPSALFLALHWGSSQTMHTRTLPYPSAGEHVLFADDRFTFEHVTKRLHIHGEVRACSRVRWAVCRAHRLRVWSQPEDPAHPFFAAPLADPRCARARRRAGRASRGWRRRFEWCCHEPGKRVATAGARARAAASASAREWSNAQRPPSRDDARRQGARQRRR